MSGTVVVAPNWVGDLVMALPVLDALASGGRRLAVLTKPGLAPLLTAARPGIAAIERAATDRDTVARLRSGAFDEAVVLPNSFRSAWLPFRAGIPRRFGYRGDGRGWMLRPAVGRPRRRGRPQVEDYAELLAAMGAAPPATWVPRVELAPALAGEGRALLARAGIAGASGPLVGLFPGAEFGPSKRWPAARFVALARELRRAIPALCLALVAGPKEVWLAVKLHEQTGRIHPVVGPDLDLARLAAVLAHLDLLVTNDSGPMHLAAALGVPTVALFGPTDPRRTAPAGPDHQVLWSHRWCSPCFRRRCPLLHHGCMRDLDVTLVEAACQAVLGRSGGARRGQRADPGPPASSG